MSEFNRREDHSPSAEAVIGELRYHAHAAAQFLDKSWAYPEEPDATLERLALWHTVRLDAACEHLLHREVGFIIPLHGADEREADLERYEVQAAMSLIYVLVPFRSDRERLRHITDMEGEDWGEHVIIEAPEVVDEWHRWLWSGHRADRHDAEQGEAAMVALAATRLSDRLREV
jgi:hypothetical protein